MAKKESIFEQFKKFLDTKRISQKTKENYLEMVKNFLDFVDNDVTESSVKKWIEYVRNTYKHTAWRQYFVPLRTLLQRLYPEIYAVVIDELKVPYKRAEYEIISYLDFWKVFREAEKIAKTGNKKYVILVGLAGLVGLKSGEIIEVKGTHIKDKKLYFPKYPHPFEIPEKLWQYLKEFEGKDQYLLTTEDGQQIKASYLSLMLRSLQKKSKIKLRKKLSVEILRNVAIARLYLSQPSLKYVSSVYNYNSIKAIEEIARFIDESGDLRTILTVTEVKDVDKTLELFEKLSIPVRMVGEFKVVSRTILVDERSRLRKYDFIFIVRKLNEWYTFLETMEFDVKQVKDNWLEVKTDSIRILLAEYEY